MALRRATTVAAAALLLTACLQPAFAHAAAGSADLDVYVAASASGSDSTMAAVGADALFEAYLSNYGPSDEVVTVSLSVTGGTVTSVSVEEFGIAANCVANSSTSETCTTDKVPGDGEGSTFDVHTTAAHAGTITLTATVSSAASDPNPDDDSSQAQITAVVPPPASLTTTSSYDIEGGYVEGFQIDAHLTRSDTGDDIADNDIDVQVRDASASTWTDDGTVETDFDGHADVYLSQLDSGDFDVQLIHAASAQVGAITKVLNVVAPATSLAASVTPATVGRSGTATIKGTLTATGTGQPQSDQTLNLQRRATGSSTWHTIDTDYTNANGVVTDIDSPAAPSDYRWVHASSLGSGASASPVVSLAMTPSLAETVSPAINPPGYHSVLSAKVGPKSLGAVAHLEQLRGGTWVTLHSVTVPASGGVSWTLKFPKKGQFSYRVALDSASYYQPRVGKTVTVTITTKGLGKKSAYSFLQMYRGKPMRWNPCRAIGYKVNPKLGPPGALAMVKETLRRIHLANGLRFHYEGRTKTHPVWGVVRHQAAKLVISWVTAKGSDGMFNYGYEVGFGGATEAQYLGGHDVITQGGALLLAASDPRTNGIAPGFGAGVTWGELLMHELGHAMGLDHTNGKWQIMQPVLSNLPAAMYGAGDLHGLHLLGRSQGCLP